MPTGYQIKDQSAPHYLTFQLVYWIDLFLRLLQDLYALYKVSDTSYKSMGKITLLTYELKTLDMVIVPLEGVSYNFGDVQTELNKIYGPLGIEWRVKTDSVFRSMEWDLVDNDILDAEESQNFSMYSPEMRALNRAYSQARPVDKKTMYLFVLKGIQGKDTELLGDMPLASQFGYLAASNNQTLATKTIAHELGHGMFYLRHTFGEKYELPQGQTDNLMDYSMGTRLFKQQWDEIFDPRRPAFAWRQDEEEGAIRFLQGAYVRSYIDNIRCLRQKGETTYFASNFKFNYGEFKYDPWSDPKLLNNEKYGNIWAWYTCETSEPIDITFIQRKGVYVYVGKETGCQLKFIIRDGNYNEIESLSQTFMDYLMVSSDTYNYQFNKLLVDLSIKHVDIIKKELINMSNCMFENFDVEWRLFFFEKIINQDSKLTISDAIIINRLFSSVRDENQARILIANIKEKGYDKKMMKTILNTRSNLFSEIANGLSWLYYSQDKNPILEAGKNIDAENFFAWEPYGNVRDKYKALVNNPSFSNIFDWVYNTRTYSYTVHLEDDGRFRVHVIGTEFSHLVPATFHYNFYISPLEPVSVYFASKNKYLNIEDYMVVMPGILLAWIIDQGERETNQLLVDIGITAASFYFSALTIAKATGTAGKIINSILFVKGFSDLIIKSGNEDLGRILGRDFIESYKNFSNIIDCVLIFKQFADEEINQQILILSKAWNEMTEGQKLELQNNFPQVFSFIELKIKELQ